MSAFEARAPLDEPADDEESCRAGARRRIEREQVLLAQLFEQAAAQAAAIAERAAALHAATPIAPEPEAADAQRGLRDSIFALTRFALAHERLGRSMHNTSERQQKLDAALERLESIAEHEAGGLSRIERRLRSTRLYARKIMLQIGVERVAHDAHPGDFATVDGLVQAACEALNGEDFANVLDRPVSEGVADLCAHLGLTPDWSHLALQGWARQEIDSGKVGAPLQPVVAEWREAAAHRKASQAQPEPPPQPTWLPGEGPPPSRPRPRPYWEGPS